MKAYSISMSHVLLLFLAQSCRGQQVAMRLPSLASMYTPVSFSGSCSTSSTNPPIPTGVTNCYQQRPFGGPSGAEVADALTNNGIVNDACGAKFNGGTELNESYFHNGLELTVARGSLTEPISFCQSGFGAILDACIRNGADYGGIYTQGDQTYTVNNTEFPNNPLLPPDAGAPQPSTITLSVTATVTIISPPSTPTAAEPLEIDLPQFSGPCMSGEETVEGQTSASIPQGADSLAISIPEADRAGTKWTVGFQGSGGTPPVTSWLVTTEEPSKAIASGSGPNGLAWANPLGFSGTNLELQFDVTQTPFQLNMIVSGQLGCGGNPPPPPPPPTTTTAASAPTNPPTSGSCADDCKAMLSQKINGLADPICVYGLSNNFLDKNWPDTGFVDWSLLDSNANCYIVLAKRSSSKGFPDDFCFHKSDVQGWINNNALGCNAGDAFFRPSPPFSVSTGNAGNGLLCLSNQLNYRLCGSSTMNGGTNFGPPS